MQVRGPGHLLGWPMVNPALWLDEVYISIESPDGVRNTLKHSKVQ